jgi:hypothetical protein
MKFTNILKNIILEDSRFTLLYDKLVDKGGKKPQEGKIPFDTLKTIIFADPTTRAPQSLLQNIEILTPEQMEIVKVGKYTQWLLKNFLKPSFNDEMGDIEVGSTQYKKMTKEYKDRFLEDLYKVTDDLKKFERFKGQLPQESRDIAKLTPDSLFGLVKDFKLEKTKGSKQEKEDAKSSYQYPGSTVEFKGPNWTVVKIEDTSELGKNAACFFGGYHEHDKGESRWCTSSPGLNYFDSHIKQGPLYVILPNKADKVGQKTGLPQERYQWHFQSNQYMDRDDRPVNIIDMLNGKLIELKEFFKPVFAKGLTKQNEKRLVMENDNSSAAGKFIQLYGYKELFDNLPDDMKQIIINNNKKNDVSFDVPESIGRFDKLESLLLGGMVKSVPDSICNLTSLLMLSFPNNPQLTTIPVCIKDLPMLGFLNVSGSNVKIPEELEDVLHEEGDGYYYVV